MTSRLSVPFRLRSLVAPVTLLALTAPLLGQSKVEIEVDPYTRGDAAALERAGYVSFGPFPFGENHTTRDVEALLGDEPLHWLETAHFKIGSALPAYAVKNGDKDWKTSLKQELTRLRERLPTVKTSVRELDPWLRMHLIAQRLEDCYAEVQRHLGVTDADFPATMMDGNAPPETYYGEGPYLGMKQKFTVLLVQRMASNARYTRAYGNQEVVYPTRIYFPGYGGLGVCMSEEYNGKQLTSDHVLHVHMVYNVVINLLNGYRSYGHEMPAWVQLGMGHWYSRRVSPRYPVYDIKSETDREQSDFWQWDERALGLMKFEAFEPLAELLIRADGTQFGMEEHIQSWFLVDYLLHARQAETAKFLRLMTDPFHARRRSPTHDEIVARQAKAFATAFGADPDELEVEWRKNTQRLKHRK